MGSEEPKQLPIQETDYIVATATELNHETLYSKVKGLINRVKAAIAGRLFAGQLDSKNSGVSDPTMASIEEDTAEKEKPFLQMVLLKGKYAPSPQEFPDILAKLDIKALLQDSRLIDMSNGLTISFDSLEHARLFTFVLGTKGNLRELIMFNPPDWFFAPTLLKDYRIDGDQLNCTEKVEGERVNVRLNTKNISNEDVRAKHLGLIKDIVAEVMPHLSAAIANFTFSGKAEAQF